MMCIGRVCWCLYESSCVYISISSYKLYPYQHHTKYEIKHNLLPSVSIHTHTHTHKSLIHINVCKDYLFVHILCVCVPVTSPSNPKKT